MSFILDYQLQEFTGQQIENILFCPKRQKQPPEVLYKKDVQMSPNLQKNTSVEDSFVD